MNKKILIISKNIHPSKILFFNYFNNYFNKKYIFKIIFTTETESIRKWNLGELKKKIEFDYIILKPKQILINSKKDNHYFYLNFDINKILNKENPDIIIHVGWAGLSAWTSLFWSKKNNKKYILWSESTKYENSWRRVITKPIVKYLVKNSDNYISFGTRSYDYLQLLGAKKDKIFKLYNSIDNNFFINKSNSLKLKKEKLKEKYGVKTKYTLLFIGQFISRKGIFELLDGFVGFQKKNKDISLLMVGTGSSENELKEIIKNKNIKNVIFQGFIQQDKISELYSISDIFTLPSLEEVWGLVINEAMCFGLPILTAYKVGASVDLVQEGKNGYIMRENTSKEVFYGLEYIFNNLLISKNNSIDIINNMKIDNFLKNLKF